MRVPPEIQGRVGSKANVRPKIGVAPYITKGRAYCRMRDCGLLEANVLEHAQD